MSFDLLVLLLSIIGLVSSPGRSSLWHLLFKQGIVYFLVAFVANLMPAVLLLLNLNRTSLFLCFSYYFDPWSNVYHDTMIAIMNIMFTIPAAVATSIVACRSFVALTRFRNKDVYVQYVTIFLSPLSPFPTSSCSFSITY